MSEFQKEINRERIEYVCQKELEMFPKPRSSYPHPSNEGKYTLSIDIKHSPPKRDDFYRQMTDQGNPPTISSEDYDTVEVDRQVIDPSQLEKFVGELKVKYFSSLIDNCNKFTRLDPVIVRDRFSRLDSSTFVGLIQTVITKTKEILFTARLDDFCFLLPPWLYSYFHEERLTDKDFVTSLTTVNDLVVNWEKCFGTPQNFRCYEIPVNCNKKDMLFIYASNSRILLAPYYFHHKELYPDRLSLSYDDKLHIKEPGLIFAIPLTKDLKE